MSFLRGQAFLLSLLVVIPVVIPAAVVGVSSSSTPLRISPCQSQAHSAPLGVSTSLRAAALRFSFSSPTSAAKNADLLGLGRVETFRPGDGLSLSETVDMIPKDASRPDAGRAVAIVRSPSVDGTYFSVLSECDGLAVGSTPGCGDASSCVGVHDRAALACGLAGATLDGDGLSRAVLAGEHLPKNPECSRPLDL